MNINDLKVTIRLSDVELNDFDMGIRHTQKSCLTIVQDLLPETHTSLVDTLSGSVAVRLCHSMKWTDLTTKRKIEKMIWDVFAVQWAKSYMNFPTRLEFTVRVPDTFDLGLFTCGDFSFVVPEKQIAHLYDTYHKAQLELVVRLNMETHLIPTWPEHVNWDWL
jgi:hypothetical protein